MSEERRLRRRRSVVHRFRAAFTLLETMLVLALLVVVSALSWPALEKPFASQRLLKSADQLHADLTRGRAAAIRSGQAHQLMLETTYHYCADGTDLSGTRYSVAPVDLGEGAATGLDPLLSDPAPMAAATTQALPEGVTIADVEVVDDVTLAPQPAGLSLPPIDASAPSRIVYFHPDGTTSSARFRLTNEYGSFVDVELRGLTGAVAVSDVQASAEAAR